MPQLDATVLGYPTDEMSAQVSLDQRRRMRLRDMPC